MTFLWHRSVWGGGGGKIPKCTDEQLICASERLRNIIMSCLKILSYTSAYLYNQYSSLILLMVWRYKWQYTDKTLTLREKKNLCICEQAERASLENIRILLVLQIVCRYKQHAYRLSCTDKFPNVPTKKRHYGGGGGGELSPPPPPPMRCRTCICGQRRDDISPACVQQDSPVYRGLRRLEYPRIHPKIHSPGESRIKRISYN